MMAVLCPPNDEFNFSTYLIGKESGFPRTTNSGASGSLSVKFSVGGTSCSLMECITASISTAVHEPTR